MEWVVVDTETGLFKYVYADSQRAAAKKALSSYGLRCMRTDDVRPAKHVDVGLESKDVWREWASTHLKS